jgi:4-aminobutyrate aminotransferase/diaminobutyrate-pyruvate transaminase/4-aminobutyrate aminotransferase/(S)-3-amino-2-methylpropionate transaminase
MGSQNFPLTPQVVAKVATRYRRIVTKIPVPQSLPILRKLRRYEPVSMTGQPLVVWDRGEGVQIFDRWGNRWLDWSSGVLVTNAGHGRRSIGEAIARQARHGLLHNYCFPSEIRSRTVEALARLAPPGLKKVFLLTTGSETLECAIKLCRTHGRKVGGTGKTVLVSFERAFHGRTLGAQMIGGIAALKEWIPNPDQAILQVPFPDGFRTSDTRFSLFQETLRRSKVSPNQVAGVILETYQGGGASFAPPTYIQELRRWCDRHKAILVFDEVQAGFGRTGRLFGFEHYKTLPDLFCLGKGITSGLPLSAVIGRAEVLDLFPPNSMTSTHTGNPVAAASCLANLEILRRERLVENARRMGNVLHKELARIKERFREVCGALHGKGLVAGLHIVKRGGIEPDGDLAHDVVRRCVEKGLLLFAPVGFGGATVKISPPLVIREDGVREGAAVLEEAFEEALLEYSSHD